MVIVPLHLNLDVTTQVEIWHKPHFVIASDSVAISSPYQSRYDWFFLLL